MLLSISSEQISQQVGIALAEDIGSGDLTANLIPADAFSTVKVVCREHAVICGRPWFDEVFHQLDANIQINWNLAEGDTVEGGVVICTLSGNTRALLSGERTALNYLQTLSGTATLAQQYADLVSNTKASILDTRKTLPGLRLQQKYAVTCGGCRNHRIGLYDAILIKENHVIAAGSIGNALKLAQASSPSGVEIEIEVETLDELTQALDAGGKRILLDNLNNDLLRQAVSLNQGRARLEASGGVNLQTVKGIAETGVDDISVGGLTKDVRAVDLSMRFVD